ncbi:hypothetical protein LZ32DRAFT_374427 [Colletotrichum eremochloae]|nr:hypothetical protein LZ32DRAFT_374427 [Colletotrichum eremochloae]
MSSISPSSSSCCSTALSIAPSYVTGISKTYLSSLISHSASDCAWLHISCDSLFVGTGGCWGSLVVKSMVSASSRSSVFVTWSLASLASLRVSISALATARWWLLCISVPLRERNQPRADKWYPSRRYLAVANGFN